MKRDSWHEHCTCCFSPALKAATRFAIGAGTEETWAASQARHGGCLSPRDKEVLMASSPWAQATPSQPARKKFISIISPHALFSVKCRCRETNPAAQPDQISPVEAELTRHEHSFRSAASRAPIRC